MSKKKILEESTIRRFMKLASIDALSENYFDREKPAPKKRPVYREEEEEFPPAAEEAPVEDFADEAPVDDFADEAPVESAAAGISEEAVKEIVDAIAAAVSEVTGVAIEAVGGEEPPMDDVGEEPAPPASRYQESKEAKADDEPEVQEEAVEEEDAEVKEEAVNININKADLREEDDAEADSEAKEDLEEVDDDADDKTEVKEESKKPAQRKLTEKEMVALVTKRVAARISELAKKK